MFSCLRNVTLTNTYVHRSKGAQMEILVPAECDLAKFVSSWVAAAGDAAGTCTKVCIELEGLESQGELVRLINEPMTGIQAARKGLTALGVAPQLESVDVILRQVAWLPVCSKHVIYFN